jgi:hypothetical protein
MIPDGTQKRKLRFKSCIHEHLSIVILTLQIFLFFKVRLLLLYTYPSFSTAGFSRLFNQIKYTVCYYF